MIKVENLVCGYDNKKQVKETTLEIPQGQITTIIGENGCGKSTLLKTICGVLNKISGDIYLDGKSIHTLSLKERAKIISYLPQQREYGAISVEALVSHGRFPYLSYPRSYSENDRKIIEKAMRDTNVFKYRYHHLSELSGGERQRAYIALLIAQDTKIMLFDEPTTYLDIKNQFETMALIKSLKSKNKTIVMVLHDINMALQVSDNIIVMKNGEVIDVGSPKEVLSRGAIEKAFDVNVICFEKMDEKCYTFKEKTTRREK